MSGVIDYCPNFRRDTVVRPGTYIVGVAGLCLLLLGHLVVDFELKLLA